MDKETLNLIIGGGIGFLASFLVTVATFIFQNYQSNKKHRWATEDVDRQRKLDVTNRRLERIEQEAANIMEWANTIFLRYPHYAKEGIPEERLDDLISGYLNNISLMPIAIMLGDVDLRKAVEDFGTNSLDLYNWIVEGSLGEGSSNRQDIAAIYEQLKLDYAAVLGSLDEYRMVKI